MRTMQEMNRLTWTYNRIFCYGSPVGWELLRCTPVYLVSDFLTDKDTTIDMLLLYIIVMQYGKKNIYIYEKWFQTL